MMLTIKKKVVLLSAASFTVMTIIIISFVVYYGSSHVNLKDDVLSLFKSDEATRAETAKKYSKVLQELKKARKEYQSKYHSASKKEKEILLEEAGDYLERVFNQEIVLLWLKTDYDFNGTTQTPRNGEIACGYLVSTIIKQLGFNINRVKMAQAPSLASIRTLAPRKDRFYIRPASSPSGSLKQKLATTGKGLYIIGLDYHTGFIIYNNEGIQFFHTGFRYVIKEPLKRSYRITFGARKGIYGGKPFTKSMLKKWMTKEPIQLI